MEIALVVLTSPAAQTARTAPAETALPAPTAGAAGTVIDRRILTDLLWANAHPTDGLEHVTVRAGPGSGRFLVGLFLVPGDLAPDSAARALRLCLCTVQTVPALAGWTAALLRRP